MAEGDACVGKARAHAANGRLCASSHAEGLGKAI